ncbi:glycoside hydrolase family 2 TIM barrel-domain containing protein [Anaeromicropila herbilytica]|uniref:Beta-galactosidase n=1 Tax=Anaeromicropila herbilytica TaxID=2785025 RepID=A0A7R7EKF4_9FIRM|nr:glycoside hydrolase family 2 TIM barrel-domain containing protein [Anaeromicropila herbilytica]BCN30506.1 hypothetical protein bsdtb5_18010 [Anaeromicropila herbilytica]
MSKKELFNDGWSFQKTKTDVELENLDQFKDWKRVDLPHDWLIYDANNLYETSKGWYHKEYYISSMNDQIYILRFDGIYMDSKVYINGILAGEWKYGYSTFEFDITKYLQDGRNEIVVSVNHMSPNSRWYSGAGIYRNVWLIKVNQIHIPSDGVYLSTEKLSQGVENQWKMVVDTEVAFKNDIQIMKDNLVIKHMIIDQSKQVVIESENNGIINNKEDNCFVNSQIIKLENPTLWSLDNPYLYTLRTELLLEGQLLDCKEERFGFRTIRFDSEEGFFLNNKRVKINGVCMHHDLGSLGSAMNKVALHRQLKMMKDMGANAIRTSHNMPATELMELADEMGILINSEAYDIWERPKTEYDNARFFQEYWRADVRSWIKRDRNHPSVILWSIGNEIYDTHVDKRGYEITNQLVNEVKKYDDRRNAYVTFGSNYMPWENTKKCAELLDVVGYNYGEKIYEEDHIQYENWCIYGSETAARVSSRGIYHFPKNTPIKTHDDLQCSSLDNSKSGLGDRDSQYSIIADRDTPFSAGQFIWTGFDYIGEPSPYFTKNAYFGQVDTAGFKKDSYYLYQSEWTDYRTNPIVHLLPYWDFNEGQLIDVMTYSNAPKTELFLNNQSIGVVEVDHKNGQKLNGEWQIPYQKGTLTAVAYDENDNVIATDSVTSFGDGVKIVTKYDQCELIANGQDLIFLEITTVDEQDVFVANARSRMDVSVSGAGRLVGLDNGDSTDYDSYKGTSRKLFSGKLLAIIAAKLEPGDITVTISSKGFETVVETLKALPILPLEEDFDNRSMIGVSAIMENIESEKNEEIPVRKIELICKDSRLLTKDNLNASLQAKIYPENASYQELTWSVITNSGIVTNIATVEDYNFEAVVKAIGDGEFRLRCSCNNGKESPEVISELEFKVEGLGEATINPYEFVSGSFYNKSNMVLNEVISGGVSADKDPTYIGFRGVDFKEVGSDEITIPMIHWFHNESLPVEVWEGMPNEEGAECLFEGMYQADFVWQTYIPNTFKLKRRITGLKTICIVVKAKGVDVSVKGFEFKEYNKAYETLNAVSNNRIYGDFFKIGENTIERIGNNVSIEFDSMNFIDGVRKLVVCGRTHNSQDSIHVIFSSEEGESNQIIEFNYSEEYITKEFLFDNSKGLYKVKFVFLPGCKFDFKWFQFQA